MSEIYYFCPECDECDLTEVWDSKNISSCLNREQKRRYISLYKAKKSKLKLNYICPNCEKSVSSVRIYI